MLHRTVSKFNTKTYIQNEIVHHITREHTNTGTASHISHLESVITNTATIVIFAFLASHVIECRSMATTYADSLDHVLVVCVYVCKRIRTPNYSISRSQELLLPIPGFTLETLDCGTCTTGRATVVQYSPWWIIIFVCLRSIKTHSIHINDHHHNALMERAILLIDQTSLMWQSCCQNQVHTQPGRVFNFLINCSTISSYRSCCFSAAIFANASSTWIVLDGFQIPWKVVVVHATVCSLLRPVGRVHLFDHILLYSQQLIGKAKNHWSSSNCKDISRDYLGCYFLE